MYAYNHIPDVMSKFDCEMLTNYTIKSELCEVIEGVDGEVVCCERGSIIECDELYVY